VKKPGCRGAAEAKQEEPGAHSNRLQPSPSFPATYLQRYGDLISFHHPQEGLETEKHRARGVRPKHELRGDTRGPSAPEYEVTPPPRRKICAPSRGQGTRLLFGTEIKRFEGRKENAPMSFFLSEPHSSSCQGDCRRWLHVRGARSGKLLQGPPRGSLP